MKTGLVIFCSRPEYLCAITGCCGCSIKKFCEEFVLLLRFLANTENNHTFSAVLLLFMSHKAEQMYLMSKENCLEGKNRSYSPLCGPSSSVSSVGG